MALNNIFQFTKQEKENKWDEIQRYALHSKLLSTEKEKNFTPVEDINFNSSRDEATFHCRSGKYKLRFRILEDEIVPFFSVVDEKFPVSFDGKSVPGVFNNYLPYAHSKNLDKLRLFVTNLIQNGNFSFEVLDDKAELKFEIVSLSDEKLYEKLILIQNRSLSQYKGSSHNKFSFSSIYELIDQKEDKSVLRRRLEKFEEAVMQKLEDLSLKLQEMELRHQSEVMCLKEEVMKYKKKNDEVILLNPRTL